MSPEDYALPEGWREDLINARACASYTDECGCERVLAYQNGLVKLPTPASWPEVPVSVWLRAAMRAYTLRRDV